MTEVEAFRQRKLKAAQDDAKSDNDYDNYFRDWLRYRTNKNINAQRYSYRLVVLLSIIILGVVVSTVFSSYNHAPSHRFGKVEKIHNISTWSSEGTSSRRHLLQNEETVECNMVYSYDTGEEQCKFVTENPDCTSDVKFLNYIDFIFCKTSGKMKPLGTAVCILWWLFCFIGLAVTADDFFCPSLVVISKVLHLSPNIAGVTFLAFGNGSPDVFSAIAALSTGGDPALGLGGLLGAGVFVTTVVAGTISVVTPFVAMQRPFIRDVIFYIVGVYWTFCVLWRGYMYVGESIGYIVLYGIYVVIVAGSGTIYKKQQAKKAKRKPVTQVETLLEAAVMDDERRKSRVSQSNRGSVPELERRLSIEDDKDAIELTTFKSSAEGTDSNDNNETDPKQARELRKLSQDMKALEAAEDIEKEDEDEDNDKPEEEVTELRHFLNSINPINMEEWGEMSIIAKVYEVSKILRLKGLTLSILRYGKETKHLAPLYFTITLTCPVVNYEDEESHNWCRYLQVLQLVTSPIAVVFLTRSMSVWIGGVVPLWSIALVLGVGLAIACFCTSKNEQRPVYHDAFGFLGFVMGIIWIYTLANEIVSLLKTFGIVFNINDAILGLTLLAWGNSLGDWISDTVMAKQGFARMGFSACFGGPFFNLSVGFGGAMMISQIVGGDTIRYGLKMTGVSFVLVTFLMISLAFSLVFVVFFLRFHIKRIYGMCLLALYITFVATAILAAFEVILKM